MTNLGVGPEIGEYHCRIDFTASMVPILSATGQKLPKVNGKPITQVPLKPNDVIIISPYKLMFWVKGAMKEKDATSTLKRDRSEQM